MNTFVANSICLSQDRNGGWRSEKVSAVFFPEQGP